MVSDIINIALKEYGTWEWKGESHNPQVLKYYHEIGHKWVNDDETPWCAAAANWVLLKAGYAITGRLNARSFLDYGVPLEQPLPGCVVVFSRGNPNGPFGHVGFYINQIGNDIYVLGGNQGNQFNIKPYPADRLLGYRMPVKMKR